MSYYDPMAPTMQATRFEIQRSISALQQKLRQRKALDMDIEYLRNQELARRCELASYHQELRKTSYSQLPMRGIHAEDRYYGDQVRAHLEEEEKSVSHLEKMRRLEREQLQLGVEKMRSTTAFFGNPYPSQEILPPSKPYSFERNTNHNQIYEDDFDLIRKYQDGTRAKQIRNQLDNYNNSHSGYKTGASGELSRHHHNLARPLAAEFTAEESAGKAKYSSNKKSILKNGHHNQEQRSPYSKIDFYQSQHKINSQSQHTANKNYSPSKRLEENLGQEEGEAFEQEEILKPKKSSKSFTKRNNSHKNLSNISFADNNQNQHHKGLLYQKSGKKNHKKSLGKLSRFERSRSRSQSRIALSMEQSANLKIKNRLNLSEVTFEDSKFRNIKHEVNHLQNTYENELKIRKDIKDKINNHPLILRKHAMVV